MFLTSTLDQSQTWSRALRVVIAVLCWWPIGKMQGNNLQISTEYTPHYHAEKIESGGLKLTKYNSSCQNYISNIKPTFPVGVEKNHDHNC